MPKALPIFSGSSAGRVVACPASAALPRVESSGEAAETGRAIHAFIDRRLMGMGEARALDTVPEEHRERCRHIDLAGLTAGLSVYRPEVAFGLDLERLEARELGRLAQHRAYPVEENEVGLTVDLFGITDGDMPLVLDWKTGQEVDAVEANPQMLTAAAAVALVHNVPEVEARIVYIREDGSHWVDGCVFDGLTIDAWLESLKGAHAAVLAARAEVAEGRAPSVVRPGKHCHYCPSLAACPAHVGLASSLAPELEEVGARIAALSPTEAGAAYAKARQFRAILTHVEAGLKAYAKAHPIPLEGGKEYRVTTATRRSLDSDKLTSLARRLGATDDDFASCFSEATYETVREAKARKER